MGQFGIGQPLRRKEDPRLLRGHGRYTDDVNVEGQFWAAFDAFVPGTREEYNALIEAQTIIESVRKK